MESLLLDSLFGGLALGGLRAPWSHACVAIVLWGAALKFPPRLEAVPAARLWAAWLAWTALSALFSAEPLRGLAAFSHTATAVLFFAMASSYWGLESKRLWAAGLFGMGVLLGLAVLLIDSGYGPTGLLYPYYNYTAAVQAALLAACLGALGAGAGRDLRIRLLLVAIMIFALTLILFAHSRGALAAAAAASLVWLIRRGSRRSLAAAAVAGLAIFALMPMRILTPMLKLDNPSANTRPAIWKSSMAIAREHPLLGQGPGQFERGFLRHNFPAPEGARPTRYGLRSTHAHSEFLEIAAETGWPGLILFLLALGVSWRRGLKTRPRNDRPDWSEEAAGGAFIALFTHSLVDNPLALPALKWLFFASLAVWCSPNEEKTGEAPSPGLRPVYALGLMLAALAWWPDWAVKSWRQRAWKAAGAQSVERLESALRVSPDDSGLWEDLARAQMRRRPPAAREALRALSEAERRNPTNAFYPVMTAEILRGSAAIEGRWDAILALAERALILEPRFHQARLLAAEALVHLGRSREAARKLARGAPWRDIRPPKAANPGYDTLIYHFDAARHDKVNALIRSSRRGRAAR